MRGWIVLWVAAVASIASGCAQAPGDATEVGGVDGSCSSLRVSIDSPAADEVLGTWSTQVVGRVESDTEIRNLYYEVDGTTLSLPAIAGPFSFPIGTDWRSEVQVAVLARSVEGCVSKVERVIRFDTTRWIELVQDEAWAEVTVEAPGDEVVVHWKPQVMENRKVASMATELISRRVVPVANGRLRGGEGSVTLTVQNKELEVWWFDNGIGPYGSGLAISVGTTLQMVPARVDLGVGESQWISIPNAMDAIWTVEPAAVLEPEQGHPPWNLGDSSRAGARFEAHQPGTYTVRATSVDGKRMGEATLEVKSIEQPFTTAGNLPPFPEGFGASAVVALPDGTLVAGGLLVNDPALVRLAKGSDAWSLYADVGTERRRITHLVVGEEGELFALSDAVLRISSEGAVERILESDQVSRPIASIWSAGGTLYANVGYNQTYAFDPASGVWTDAGLIGACPNLVAASDEHGLWHACMGTDRLLGPEFSGVSLAPIYDLALDDEGRLLAATSRGVQRLSGLRSWEQMAGGGPSGPGTVLLHSGQRLFAGNRSGLWLFARSAQAWVRLPISPPEQWPFFVALPDGGIVVGGLMTGGDIVEVAIGE